MTTDPSIKLRVDRLENDAESLYELTGGFRTEFNEFATETRGRFDKIESTLAEVVRRLPE